MMQSIRERKVNASLSHFKRVGWKIVAEATEIRGDQEFMQLFQ
jgi:hypothetical protein